MYFQLLFALDRVKELAPQHPRCSYSSQSEVALPPQLQLYVPAHDPAARRGR